MVPFIIGSVVLGVGLCPRLTVLDSLRSSSIFLDVVAEIPQLDRFRRTDGTDSWFGVYYVSVIGYVICTVTYRVHL